MIDPEINEVPGLLEDDDSEDVEETKYSAVEQEENHLFDLGKNKSFTFTADLTNRKHWTLLGDIVLNSKDEKILVWTNSDQVKANNTTATSDIDLAIPKEREWLRDPQSAVWSRIEYLRDSSIIDVEHQLSKDAHTYIAYDESMAHLHKNIGYILRHSPEGDLAIKRCARGLMDEVFESVVNGVVEEIMDIRSQAFENTTRMFLKGVMDCTLDTERFLKLSGRLSLVQGAVRDFVSNRNHVLRPSMNAISCDKGNRIVFERIRDAIRNKISFTPSSVQQHTDDSLVMQPMTSRNELFLESQRQREEEFFQGLRKDNIPVQFMHQIISSPVTAIQFFDHYHQHHHLHKQHHHYDNRKSPRISPREGPQQSTNAANSIDSTDSLPPEESILIAGHENGVVSLWRLSFARRHRPSAPVFLASNSQNSIQPASNDIGGHAIRDIQIHPLDPYSILITRDSGRVSWFRLRLSTFDYQKSTAEGFNDEELPQKRNQQLVVQNRRSGGLLSLLLLCFRRSKPTPTPSLPSQKKKSENKLKNSDGSEIDDKQFNALQCIVSFDSEDLPYDPPQISERRFWQEEEKKRQIFIRFSKERKLTDRNGASKGWFANDESVTNDEIHDSDENEDVDDISSGNINAEKYQKELSKCLAYPYQRADFHPRPVIACFHPAINRMTSAVSLMIASTSGDLYKFNVDMILADMSNAVQIEEKKQAATLSTSFKQYSDNKENASRDRHQWRLVPPFDASSKHVTEEYALPSQAPQGFLLLSHGTQGEVGASDSNAVPSRPKGKHRRLSVNSKSTGQSQVFREILHFHRATHSIADTMEGKLNQFILQYPSLQQSLHRSEISQSLPFAMFLQNQHRVILISPLQSSCFNPFFVPRFHERSSLPKNSKIPWNMDSLLSVDSGGCIALWRTHEVAGYQYCHWHVPRISVRLQSMLVSSSKHKSSSSPTNANVLEVFESAGNLYLVDHLFSPISDNPKKKLEKRKRSRDKNLSYDSAWKKFLRQHGVDHLRVQHRSLLDVHTQHDSIRGEKNLIETAWKRICESINKTDPCPEKWVKTDFSPIVVNSPPIVSLDSYSINTVHPVNTEKSGAPEIPRKSFWQFSKLNSMDEMKLLSKDISNAVNKAGTSSLTAKATASTLWLAQQVKRVRYEYVVVLAKLSEDKDTLCLLLHFLERSTKQRNSVSQEKANPKTLLREHWRIMLVDLKQLTLSPVQIIIRSPLTTYQSAPTSHTPPYVRDFAVSSLCLETGEQSRLIAVLVNGANTTSRSSLRFFSSLSGKEIFIFHDPVGKDIDDNWHRLQWCSSWRFLALYSQPSFVQFSSKSNKAGKNKQVNHPSCHSHYIDYYFHARGIRFDEEESDSSRLINKWFQQGNINVPPSFLAHSSKEPLGTSNSHMKLVRIRHVLDRDELALSHWQAPYAKPAVAEQKIGDQDLQDEVTQIHDVLKAVQILESCENEVLVRVEDDLPYEDDVLKNSFSSNIGLPFLLQPLPDYLANLSDGELDDAQQLSAISAKFQSKQLRHLWQNEITHSVKLWISECVEDALAIVQIHAQAKKSEAILKDMFQSQISPKKKPSNAASIGTLY